MVIDRDRERLLGVLLANDVLLQEIKDFLGLGKLKVCCSALATLGLALVNDLVAEFHTLVTDVHARSGNELLDLLLAFTEERALEKLA